MKITYVKISSGVSGFTNMPFAVNGFGAVCISPQRHNTALTAVLPLLNEDIERLLLNCPPLDLSRQPHNITTTLLDLR